MSNFSGVQKNAKPFQPRSATDGQEAGVGRVVAGVYAGQDAPVVFEKTDSPVLDTTPIPNSGTRGERELGLSPGAVEHVDSSGKAVYLAGQIARVYRQITADGAGIETLSREERRKLRDELVERVGATADGAQQTEGDSASAQATRRYVTEVASLLFGLIDELSETPAFLRGDTYTPDGLGIKSVADFMHKSATDTVTANCPHCGAAHTFEKASVSGGLQPFTCSNCSKSWRQDLSISSTFTKSANPELASLRKQLHDLTERIRQLLAARAGVSSGSNDRGNRFITKNAGNVDPAREALDKALNAGVRVSVPGENPFANKTSGARFQPRSE